MGDLGSIPGSRRSPGEGNGNPLQHSWLENPMDGGAWWATVHGVAKSRTWLSDFTFHPRSKHLLISYLQSPSTVILEFKKIKSVTVSTVSPSIFYEVIGLGAMVLFFWMLCFKPAFSLFSSPFIKRLFHSSSLSAIWVVSSAHMRLLASSPTPQSWFQLVIHPTWYFAWCTLHKS